MQFRHALSQTLTAHRPAILYTIAAAAWGGAIAAAAEDVDTDIMLLTAVAALASVVIAFQHTMLMRHQQAADRLNRAILSRPHDRDHEETGPFAIVSALHGRSAHGGSR